MSTSPAGNGGPHKSQIDLEREAGRRASARYRRAQPMTTKVGDGNADIAPLFDPSKRIETGLEAASTAGGADPDFGMACQIVSAPRTIAVGRPTASAPFQAPTPNNTSAKSSACPDVTGAVTDASQTGRAPLSNGRGTLNDLGLLAVDDAIAVQFYKAVQPSAFVLGYKHGRLIKTVSDFRALLAEADRMHEHLFFHPATLKAAWTGTTTATKDQILECSYLWGDCDAEKFTGDDLHAAVQHYASEGTRVHETILAGLNRLGLLPYILWRSGAGWQFLIKLDQAIQPDEAKTLVGKLHVALGFDPVVSNCNRLLRVPGTVNWKNGANGRVPSVCAPLYTIDAVIALDDVRRALVSIPAPAQNIVANVAAEITVDWPKVKRPGWLKSVADLPVDASPKLRSIIGHTGTLSELNNDLLTAGLLLKPYSSWSDVTYAIAAILKRGGKHSPEQIAEALLAPLHCNQHIARQKDKERTIERAINRSHNLPQVAGVTFRDYDWHGSPKPSLANAALAIRALGIKPSYDLFHHRIKLMYNGEAQTIREGLLTDDNVSAIRSLINNTYQIDCGDPNTFAAIKEIAQANAFDPVLDMLDEYQGGWDDKKRLDTWVVDYLGCADTPLNRAIGRKALIAACRRARQPGCKFDSIIVLEGVEGTNKSTAIRVLAGDENFSDQSIIGASDKEVQEQLDGIWMHENADLAGMKRADVEHVKAFASRQVDRARPAYGRVREDRPRRSIEWGTTNDDRYLLSQTGNRRIWPLKTGVINIDALKYDREQLLGEAAMYEAGGEEITLDPSLWGFAKDAQEQRRVVDPWEDILCDMPDCVIRRTGDGYERVATAQVLSQVLQIPTAQQTSAHGQRLARAMEKAGWGRNPSERVTIDGKEVRGYIRPAYGPSAAGATGAQLAAAALALTGPTGPAGLSAAGPLSTAYDHVLIGPTGAVLVWTPAGITSAAMGTP